MQSAAHPGRREGVPLPARDPLRGADLLTNRIDLCAAARVAELSIQICPLAEN
jgi:hypothetical protein